MANSSQSKINKPLTPLLKWAGGKEHELKYISPAMPPIFERYFEHFVGGGAVYFSIGQSKKKIINDKSHELINVYEATAKQDAAFFSVLDEITHNWQTIEAIVINNKVEFISIYSEYATGVLCDLQMRNRIAEFIFAHSNEFNGIFTTQFNFENQIKKDCWI